MAQLFKNNAASALTAGIVAGDTTLAVALGAAFPSPTGSDYFLLTLIGYDTNGNENAWEIIKVTARAVNSLTVVRGQEGTTAQSWDNGTRVEMRLTAGSLGTMAGQNASAVSITGGSISIPTLTLTQATGIAPMTVSSATMVTNLNANFLQGKTWAAPGAIGGETPAAGAFTALSATTAAAGDALTITNGGASPAAFRVYTGATSYGVSIGNGVTGAGESIQFNPSNNTVTINTASSARGVFSSTGLAVTGAQTLNAAFGDTQTTLTLVEPGGRSLVLRNPTSVYDGEVSTGTNHPITIGGTGAIRFNIGNVGSRNTVATIDGSGNWLVGKAAQDTTSVGFSVSAGGAARCVLTGTSTLDAYQFYRAGGGNVGTITCTSTGTTYNTSSDYRLKNIDGPITAEMSGVFIDSLLPKHGTWKIDGSRFCGFIAHEFQQTSPSSVKGIKDGEDDEGNPIYQAMQASSPEVMANVIAEIQFLRGHRQSHESRIQEQQAQIESLTARLKALEAA
jgi:hypothetical protein